MPTASRAPERLPELRRRVRAATDPAGDRVAPRAVRRQRPALTKRGAGCRTRRRVADFSYRVADVDPPTADESGNTDCDIVLVIQVQVAMARVVSNIRSARSTGTLALSPASADADRRFHIGCLLWHRGADRRIGVVPVGRSGRGRICPSCRIAHHPVRSHV